MDAFREYDGEQIRILSDAICAYDDLAEARGEREKHRGYLRWIRVKGREYLAKGTDRIGRVRSLGPRSTETERIHAAFYRNKARATERVRGLSAKVRRLAAFARAARIARVPIAVTRILGRIEDWGLLGRSVVVVGTHALYTYEAMAGGRIESDLVATEDVDLLLDGRKILSVAREPPAKGGEDLLSVIREADPSFVRDPRRKYRAANDAGFAVEVVTPPADPRRGNIIGRSFSESLIPAEIEGLDWLLSAGRISQVVIGEDGRPARMAVSAPNAFAIHKAWMSERQDRRPADRRRDLAQAAAVFDLCRKYLPRFPFTSRALRNFPRTVSLRALRILEARS